MIMQNEIRLTRDVRSQQGAIWNKVVKKHLIFDLFLNYLA